MLNTTASSDPPGPCIIYVHACPSQAATQVTNKLTATVKSSPQPAGQVGRVSSCKLKKSMMLDLVLVPTVLDLLHGCLIVSVSSLLIVLVLVLQPLAGHVASASRGICSASRSVAARLQPSRDADDGGCDGAAVAPPPPHPRRPRRRDRYCERCAASWSDVVAAVTTRLCLQEEEMDGYCHPGDDDAAACGGCAVEELLERKEATESELREAFYVFDRDEDGFVSAEELWNVLRRLGMPEGAAQEDCARMIAAHDGDGDGRISFREFRAMMEDAV